MKRILLTLSLLLMLCTPASAWMNVVTAGGGVGAVGDPLSCTCNSPLTFCWHGENTTLTSESPTGCSAGDTTASAVSDATISDGVLSFPTSGDYFTLDTASIIAPEAGAIQFEVKVNTFVNATYYFEANQGSPNQYIRVYSSGSTGSGDIDVAMRIYDGSGGDLITANSNRSTGEWVLVRARWRESGDPNDYIEVCDTDGTNCVSSSGNTDYNITLTDGEKLKIGNANTAAANISMRNIKIWSEYHTW